MSLLNKASLIQIPSGYKDGTLYSAKPTNGDGDFTFSRGSNLAATRVNSDGLIEKGRENELTYSNTFDTHWTGQLISSVVSGQSGYDGTSDAWLLTPTASTGQHHLSNALTGPAGVYNTSYYVKDSGAGFAFLQCVDSGGGNFYGYFDLSDGSSVSNNYGGSGTIISTDSVSLGNGWFRLSMTMNGSGATSSRVGIASARAVGAHLAILTTADQILIQDAQLELGLVATDYIETGASTAQAGILEDMPRLDYSGGATCGSLLLEGQRSNLLTKSEYIHGWLNAGGTSSQNSEDSISPEGLYNSAVLDASSIRFQTLSISSSAYSYSVYAKAKSGSILGLRIDTPTTKNTYFNLSDGTIQSTGSGHTASIEAVGNGWYRCIISFTDSIVNAVLQTTSSGSVYVWGAMLEEGSYPTSYIPTYGASVTRGVDFSDNNDIVSNPISFGANDNFTLFYEGSFDDLSSTSNMIMGGGNKSVGNAYKNYWWIQNATSIRITGDSEVLMASASMSLTDNTNHKLLVKRDGSTIDFFVDGSKLTTTQSTPNTAFVFRSLGWSYTNSVYKVSGNIKQALIFNSALTDAECEQLTTI